MLVSLFLVYICACVRVCLYTCIVVAFVVCLRLLSAYLSSYLSFVRSSHVFFNCIVIYVQLLMIMMISSHTPSLRWHSVSYTNVKARNPSPISISLFVLVFDLAACQTMLLPAASACREDPWSHSSRI